MNSSGAGDSSPALIGWQTLLADLALILFMVTAAAVSATGPTSHRAAQAQGEWVRSPVIGEPLALWRAGGSQSLRHWLSGEQRDDRQQLTITVHYRPGTEAKAMAAAQALVGEAGVRGQFARVIVAPVADATSADMQASLAYDQAPAPAR